MCMALLHALQREGCMALLRAGRMALRRALLARHFYVHLYLRSA